MLKTLYVCDYCGMENENPVGWVTLLGGMRYFSGTYGEVAIDTGRLDFCNSGHLVAGLNCRAAQAIDRRAQDEN